MDRPDLVSGVEVKYKDGPNAYKIVEREDRYLLLECVWFGGEEDLGDEIFCKREGQRIWIAMYHGCHLVNISGDFA